MDILSTNLSPCNLKKKKQKTAQYSSEMYIYNASKLDVNDAVKNEIPVGECVRRQLPDLQCNKEGDASLIELCCVLHAKLSQNMESTSAPLTVEQRILERGSDYKTICLQ